MADESITTILAQVLSLFMEALTTTWGQAIALAIVATIAYKVFKASRRKARIHAKTFKSKDFEAVIHDDHVAFSGNKGKDWTLFDFAGCSKELEHIFENRTITRPTTSSTTGYVNAAGGFVGNTTTREGYTFTGAYESGERLIKIKQVHPYEHDFGIKTHENATLLIDVPKGHGLDPFIMEDTYQILASDFVKYRTFRGTIPEKDVQAFCDWWRHHAATAFTPDISAVQKRYSENEAKAIKDMKAKYPEAKHSSLIMKSGGYDLLGFCGLTAKDEMIVENFATGEIKRGGFAGMVRYFKENSYLKSGHGVVAIGNLTFSTNKEFSKRLSYLMMKAGMSF